MTKFALDRFTMAQNPVYNQVLAELAAGAKRTHWMWFIFPQIAGLGVSPTARFYAIASRGEASAYLGHNVLGARLRDCTSLVNAVQGRSAHAVFGTPDDLKFHSSMTLFAATAPDEAEFRDALQKFFDGRPDQATLDRL